MKKFLLCFLMALTCLSTVNAQGFGYDEKKDLGNGLYKVKSGDCYGIIDKNANVIVSVEYQDILFREGKALLTKEDVLYGIVDTLGNIKTLESKYKVHPKYRYVYEGHIIVGYDRWGYITEDGTPLHLKTKMKGAFSIGKKQPTLFDDVVPFVDGCAAVYTKKNGWKHIDTNGVERFVLSDKKAKALLCTSVYKGECIIITDDGIKQYQERNGSQAVVKRIFSSTATVNDMIQDSNTYKVVCKEGTLTLDSLMRAIKYENEKDSIAFIEMPRRVVVKKESAPVPVDTASVKEDLRVKLSAKNLQANEKGKAYAEIKLINASNNKFEELSVTLVCAGTRREWNGELDGKSEVKIAFNIPARFSAASIKRNIVVGIKYKNEYVEHECSVTIARYTPVRSR